MTWPKKGAGFFQCQEPLLCAAGSQFVELAIGCVVDAACDIAYAAAVEIVSSALIQASPGVLDAFEVTRLQGEVQLAESQGLVAPGLASAVTVTVNPVLLAGNVQITGVVLPDAFANGVDFTVSIANGS